MAHSWLERQFLQAVRKMAGPIPIYLDSDRDSRPSSPTSIIPIVRFRDVSALLALLRNPTMNFGDLFTQGRIEVEGDLVRLIEEVYRLPHGRMRKMIARLGSLLPSNSLSQSRRNIRHHYDLSNDFYSLWLDSQMVYTCAYFPDQKASLEEAQTAKLDLVSRKLWLQPGETVIEAGCGWGALAIHMARRYGVKVKAFNISHEQIVFAREQAREQGVANLVEFLEDDYRNIRGSFDVFVSVGMLEHVGRSHYRDLGRVVHRVLGSNGRGLLHFIGRNRPQPIQPWIRKRIFPGSYVPTLREAFEVLEPHDLSILDVENLRQHYARTLEFWLSRFEKAYESVVERFGTRFARMWRLYLAGSTAAFRLGSLQLFQVVFAGRACALPWNREYLYRDAGEQDRRGTEWIHATS